MQIAADCLAELMALAFLVQLSSENDTAALAEFAADALFLSKSLYLAGRCTSTRVPWPGCDCT
jgi:hypothetical protein